MKLWLNGWQRMGVVLSIAWIAGAGLAQRTHDTSVATTAYQLAYKTCADSKPDFAACAVKGSAAMRGALVDSWPNVVVAALAPVIAAWLLAYLLILMGRWIGKGFRQRPE